MPPTVDVKDFTDTQKQLLSSAAALGTGINTINTQQLAGGSNPIQLPDFPQTNPNELRSAISSIPSVSDLYNGVGGGSAAKNTQSTLAEQLVSEMRGLSDAGAYTDGDGNIVAPAFRAQKEQELGVTGLERELTDLGSTLTSLKNEANAIPLAVQEEFKGTGATLGGAEPIETSRLRTNAIKALTISSIAQFKLGRLESARNEVDKAVQTEFAPKIARLQTLQKAYDLNKDLLEQENKDKADKLKSMIDERTRLLGIQMDDRKTGLAMSAAAAGLNPNNPEAQSAAQKASALDVNDPNYLTKVLKLVGKYQADPLATAQAAADLEYKRALTAKARADVSGGAGGAVSEQLYSGLSSATATAVRGKVGKFSSEPLVQNFATIQEGYNFASSLSDTTKNPADDQALIYSLAKALDPGSVVREGEYATAQRYAQSWVNAYGKGVEQALLGTGFLSEQARRNIKQTIKQKYEASKLSYDNTYKQYSNSINTLTGRSDGTSFLEDYYIEPTSVVRNIDQFAQFRSQLSQGEVLVLRNGQPYAVAPNEINFDTDTLPPDPSIMSLR